MMCVNCFFSREYQKKLKESTFGHNRFENRLTDYVENYLNELSKLISMDKCPCKHKYTTSGNYVKYTNDLMNCLKNNMPIIDEISDVLIKVYKTFITKSYKHAADLFWESISKFNLIGAPKESIMYIKSHFRARIDEKGIYNNIYDLFHPPFDKRNSIGNQRFSISGQPMLYLANSIIVLTKEVATIDEVSIAAFVPKHQCYYSSKISDVGNSISDSLVNLPGLFDAGSNVTFNDKSYISKIRRSILCELLTFPRKDKVDDNEHFVEEYVLPQLLTSLLIDNGYKGIIYPSTKDYSAITNYHRFSNYDNNIAFFVGYNETENYDQYLLDTFYTFVLDGSEKYTYTIKDFMQKYEYAINLNKRYNAVVNNNSYIILLCNTKRYIEDIETSTINGINYFDTREGKTELEFYLKLADELTALIIENIKSKTGAVI